MNIQNYLTNPMGKGSSVLMLSNAKRELDNQYMELYTKITVKWYVLDDKYYIAHVKVPSKSKENLFYDVLLEFDIDTFKDQSTSVINNANVRVFSNCPSFAFTYANVFNYNGDLISWTTNKYPKDILRKNPEIRNPNQIVSYERSLYFAIKYILSNGRNYKAKVNQNIFRVRNYLQIYNQLQSLNEILELYNKRPKYGKEDKKSEDTPNNKGNKVKKESGRNKSHTVSKVKSTSTTRKTSKTKKSTKLNKF